MCFIFLYNFCSKHVLPQNIQQVSLVQFVHQHVYIFMQNIQRRLSISQGKYATLFQAEIYAVLACAFEIQTNVRSGKYVSICSDSQVALKALHAAKTSSLVRQCRKMLNDISTRAHWGCIGFLDMLGYKEMVLPTSSQEMVRFKSLLDLSRPWGSLGRM